MRHFQNLVNASTGVSLPALSAGRAEVTVANAETQIIEPQAAGDADHATEIQSLPIGFVTPKKARKTTSVASPRAVASESGPRAPPPSILDVFEQM